MHEAAVDPYDAADGPGRAQGSAQGEKGKNVPWWELPNRGLKSQSLQLKALRLTHMFKSELRRTYVVVQYVRTMYSRYVYVYVLHGLYAA